MLAGRLALQLQLPWLQLQSQATEEEAAAQAMCA
jgi:hypothetical protein